MSRTRRFFEVNIGNEKFFCKTIKSEELEMTNYGNLFHHNAIMKEQNDNNIAKLYFHFNNFENDYFIYECGGAILYD